MATPPEIREARQRIATLQQELRTRELFDTMVNLERAKLRINQLEREITSLSAPTPRVSVALSPHPTIRQQQQQILREIRNIDDTIQALMIQRRQLERQLERITNPRDIPISRKRITKRRR